MNCFTNLIAKYNAILKKCSNGRKVVGAQNNLHHNDIGTTVRKPLEYRKKLHEAYWSTKLAPGSCTYVNTPNKQLFQNHPNQFVWQRNNAIIGLTSQKSFRQPSGGHISVPMGENRTMKNTSTFFMCNTMPIKKVAWSLDWIRVVVSYSR